MTAQKPSDRLLLMAFTLSGAAALGYEILWTRLLALALGHEVLGVLGTLAGFFAGMAIGSAFLHRRAIESDHPVRLFVRLEAGAATFALISPDLLHAAAARLPALLGARAGTLDSVTLSLLVATLILLPGTFCLGATLPAVVAAYRRARLDDGSMPRYSAAFARARNATRRGLQGSCRPIAPTIY